MDKEQLFLVPIYELLGIKNKKVKSKATQYMYTLDLKCPNGIGSGDNCKYIVCLHLACKACGIHFDKDKALSKSGASLKVYRDAFNVISNILNISPFLPMKEMSERLGYKQLNPVAATILAKYKERFLAGLTKDQQKNADFRHPVFETVALFLASEYLNVNIAKEKLLGLNEVAEKEFESKYESMKELTLEKISQKDEVSNVTIKPSINTKKMPKRSHIKEKDATPLKETESTPNEGQVDDRIEPSLKEKQVISRSILNEILTPLDELDDKDFEKALSEAAGPMKPLSETEKRKRDREMFENWKQRIIEQGDRTEKGKVLVQSKINFKRIKKVETEDTEHQDDIEFDIK